MLAGWNKLAGQQNRRTCRKDEKSWAGSGKSGKLVRREALVIALKGTKPREYSGSQPDRSLRRTLKSAEA